ncbi:MAG TPA: hypothetical protein DDX85_12705 [Nitrospiraceae bacterium]|nr:hypothetical protein [Nitrospiraceae bacterium]
MKNSMDDIKVSCDLNSKSKIRDLWNKQVHKIKHGSFTCPLCRESFAGIGAFGAHLKDHCT